MPFFIVYVLCGWKPNPQKQRCFFKLNGIHVERRRGVGLDLVLKNGPSRYISLSKVNLESTSLLTFNGVWKQRNDNYNRQLERPS